MSEFNHDFFRFDIMKQVFGDAIRGLNPLNCRENLDHYYKYIDRLKAEFLAKGDAPEWIDLEIKKAYRDCLIKDVRAYGVRVFEAFLIFIFGSIAVVLAVLREALFKTPLGLMFPFDRSSETVYVLYNRLGHMGTTTHSDGTPFRCSRMGCHGYKLEGHEGKWILIDNENEETYASYLQRDLCESVLDSYTTVKLTCFGIHIANYKYADSLHIPDRSKDVNS